MNNPLTSIIVNKPKKKKKTSKTTIFLRHYSYVKHCQMSFVMFGNAALKVKCQYYFFIKIRCKNIFILLNIKKLYINGRLSTYWPIFITFYWYLMFYYKWHVSAEEHFNSVVSIIINAMCKTGHKYFWLNFK